MVRRCCGEDPEALLDAYGPSMRAGRKRTLLLLTARIARRNGENDRVDRLSLFVDDLERDRGNALRELGELALDRGLGLRLELPLPLVESLVERGRRLD